MYSTQSLPSSNSLNNTIFPFIAKQFLRKQKRVSDSEMISWLAPADNDKAEHNSQDKCVIYIFVSEPLPPQGWLCLAERSLITLAQQWTAPDKR